MKILKRFLMVFVVSLAFLAVGKPAFADVVIAPYSNTSVCPPSTSKTTQNNAVICIVPTGVTQVEPDPTSGCPFGTQLVVAGAATCKVTSTVPAPANGNIVPDVNGNCPTGMHLVVAGQATCQPDTAAQPPAGNQPVAPANQTGPCIAGANGLDLTNCYILNTSTGATVGSVFSTPASIINLLVKVIFIASGIALFLMIIYSGFSFISGGTKGQEQAKKVMTSAIVGMIVVFSAYWIMQIIRIVTGADIGF